MTTTINRDNDELRDLYRELILDHARSPRHFGKLHAATHMARGINPLCGDRLQLFLQLDGDQRITEASFEGSGCAISVASASLLTDTIIGMQVPAALEVSSTLTEQLRTGDSGDAESAQLGKLKALFGVHEFPARVKCATLAWHAMNSAIRNSATPATTE
ncbi:MAG: SUF system NifU family Fe-S cluster assembly protein [Proteobacteria bacterium]|nr:SUF system NifU family Fe-S cluster assembly protein [Pseudomonadota bacterium]MDA1064373.1 SUF system NifU family Fe-S cluster assembly protein [Pseudomonadota bacterium]